MARKRTFGSSVRHFVYRVIGGLIGLGVAVFIFLGPLNHAPQVAFDQATGFLAVFFTAVLAYFGLELGSWVASDAGSADTPAQMPDTTA